MNMDSIKGYLASQKDKTPFFLFISDEDYPNAIDDLKTYGLSFVPMSSFSGSEDKVPNIDALTDCIVEADMNAKSRKFVVTGLGEYLALRGKSEAKSALFKLKTQNTGNAKVILLLRGLAALIPDLKSDPRFDARRYCVVGNAYCDASITLADSKVSIPKIKGFRTLLKELESGRSGNIIVDTSVNLNNSLLTVNRIDNSYEGIKFTTLNFPLTGSCGTDDQWDKLLNEVSSAGNSLEGVFDKHEIKYDTDNDFYTHIIGSSYENWLYFIYLKCKADTIENSYLRFVLDRTNRFEDFSGNILNAIIDVSPEDRRFEAFYQERKALVEKYPESDIADFVVKNRHVVAQSIFRLTDNTKAEREEIIAWISTNGMIANLESIYPALAAYMKEYVFKCPELAELLTGYFEAYKRQKLSNKLEIKFLKQVDELACPPREFNLLPTRNEIIESIDKEGAYLYWLDALGVEYLSFIEALSLKHGLSMHIYIVRSELPTITSFNRGFFDEWKGDKKEKPDRDLDSIKHKEDGGYNFTNNELPIHLAKELDVISSVIDKAATGLALRHYKRFLIVSDHGASRLAVLRRKEEKYETDTVGKHSGRCCKAFSDYDLPFAAEENGYLILADYGRFKGSRAANVEVHGGASLEEVVIPIIELSLKNGDITVKLVEEEPPADPKNGTGIELYFDAPVKDVSVVVNGKSYLSIQTDANHFNVKLYDIKHAGNYSCDVYSGDDLIGKVLIRAKSKSGKVNPDFDDLFSEV